MAEQMIGGGGVATAPVLTHVAPDLAELYIPVSPVHPLQSKKTPLLPCTSKLLLQEPNSAAPRQEWIRREDVRWYATM